MEEQFVPYELAVKLKKLGFDDECFGYYTGDKKHLILRPNMSRRNAIDVQFVTTPLWQQAFDWFREKYNLDSYVRQTTYREWKLEITYIMQNDSKEEWEKCKRFQDYKETYEEARQACLEKLIQILEEKK